MKNKNLFLIGSLLMVVFTTILTISCNKKFDEPPTASQINLESDTSITNHLISVKELKSKHTMGNLDYITDNYIISVLVGSSDESGNFYKSLAVQDSTGGITILLDRSGLYTDYPVGRRLYIKCKGLYISDYSGYTIQLGAVDNTVPTNRKLTSIPSSLFDTYIVKGKLGNKLSPKIVTLAQLNAIGGLATAKIPLLDTLQSTLIQLNGVGLAATDVGLTYADTSASKNAASRNITDSNGTFGIVLYTTGYANFAGLIPPSGTGTLTGIFIPYYYSKNKTYGEIMVRDTSDVKFYSGVPLFSETFPNIKNSVIITSTSNNVWKNIAEIGGMSYKGYVSGTTRMASISGYVAGGNPSAVKSWMITQAINIPSTTVSPKLTFVSEDGYYSGATFEVLVSTDYDSSKVPSKSTWTTLPATIPTGDAKFTKPVASGSIDLSSYIGRTIYLAWRYTTTTSAQGGTGYEFGTVKVAGN